MSINASPTITQIVINAPAGTTQLVADPGVGMRIYVVTIVFSVDTAATTVKFAEGVAVTDLTALMEFPDGGGLVAIGDGENPILHTPTTNSRLNIVTVGGAARGWLRYFVAA